MRCPLKVINDHFSEYDHLIFNFQLNDVFHYSNEKEEFIKIFSEIERLFSSENSEKYYTALQLENGIRCPASLKLLNRFEYAKKIHKETVQSKIILSLNLHLLVRKYKIICIYINVLQVLH